MKNNAKRSRSKSVVRPRSQKQRRSTFRLGASVLLGMLLLSAVKHVDARLTNSAPPQTLPDASYRAYSENAMTLNTPVPEPGTLSMLASSAVAVAFCIRKQRNFLHSRLCLPPRPIGCHPHFEPRVEGSSLERS